MYNIDIETYSSVDIRKCGVYKYIESPDFEILLIGVKPVASKDVYMYDIAHGDKFPIGILGESNKAWNATFERLCLNAWFGIETKDWRCTQLKAMILGLPAALGKCAEVLDIKEQKIKTDLINRFSKPDKSGKPRERSGIRWEEFKEYCAQDVRTEAAIDSKLPTIPVEWSLYDHNSKVNDFGIMVDPDLVKAAINLDGKFKENNLEKLKTITGLENPNSDSQMKTWLNSKGLKNEKGENIESLAAEKVEIYLGHLKSGIEALEELKPTPDSYTSLTKDQWTSLVKTNRLLTEVLELRKLVKKTSSKKYEKINSMLCSDNRLRGLLQFYGANGTGRYAGRGVQAQNLYRPGVDGSELTELRGTIKAGQDPRVKFGYDAISQAIRTSFIAPNGLTAIDFSAIEARVLSWLAGEEWRNEVFATHGKIYEAAAANLFGITIDKVTKEQRKKGKVAELALGYQGGVGALRRMGADGTDEELDAIKFSWRMACPKIVELWYGVQDAVIKALEYGIKVQVGEHLRIGTMSHEHHRWLVIQLPSKRCLYYYNPRYEGNEIRYLKGVTDTYGYGGKFVENIVQAIARDCLVVGLMRLQHLNIVMHVHDEIIIEGNHLDKAKTVLEKPISWAPGLVLKAEGYYNNYYKK
jgi:DNA polymerase